MCGFPEDRASLRTNWQYFTDTGIQHRISHKLLRCGSSAARAFGVCFASRSGTPLVMMRVSSTRRFPAVARNDFVVVHLHTRYITFMLTASVATHTVPDDQGARAAPRSVGVKLRYGAARVPPPQAEHTARRWKTFIPDDRDFIGLHREPR